MSGSGWQPDIIGSKMQSDAHAREAAIRFAGEVMRYEPQQLAQGTFRIDLHDHSMEFRMMIDVTLHKV
ncbi:MAG: hypothetical protein DI537_41040 [Stutzerimonas stutzeri]|jgi:hypothetical protein|nr:MAG: hypothetical protein DI537_41040 [Stutzerimonas stutzeri]